MSEAGSGLAWLREPRLAALAASPLPAWLWSADAARIMFANPTGAAIFGAQTPAALATRRFDPGQPAAAQIAKLAETLPAEGARLERLRGFGAGVGRALTCQCARMTLADGTQAILIAAIEPAGPELPLNERVRRLLAHSDAPIAAFAADGSLIHAATSARDKLKGAQTLAELGAEALAAAARDNGHAAGDIGAGPIAIDRIGSGDATVLIASFVTPAAAPQAQPPAPAQAAMRPEPPTRAEPRTAAGERRHPLRFVWQIDAEDRFMIDSEEFVALAGPQTAAQLGRPWDDVAAKLALDPDGHVGRAITTHETWSGLNVAWPFGEERLSVEMSGLPVFDRERTFRGYRGFGVCRDVARLNAIALMRQAESEAPGLTDVERNAFQELARRMTDRLTAADGGEGATFVHVASPIGVSALPEATPEAAPVTLAEDDVDRDLLGDADLRSPARAIGAILDRLPVGVLVYRLNHLLYANRAFLRWTGYESVAALTAAGGLDSLIVEPGAIALEQGAEKTFAITSNGGERKPAEGRLFLIPWEGDSAFALVTTPVVPPAAPAAIDDAALKAAQAEAAELTAILDTATDGVIVLDGEERIVSTNRSAQALFGYDAEALEGQAFFDLFAPESIDVALDYLAELRTLTVASLINDGREVTGRERHGALVPLFMTLGRLGDGKLCAVFRDLTQWKKTEEELTEARRAAEKQSSAKSEFLAKISHEIRNPLNAIIGFSEVMMEERFGPVGNDRYRQYLKDIHASGSHLLSLVNDLLDLSKIEAGKLELSFAGVALNDLTAQCVAIMQPQANRERVIIRTSLAPRLPQVMADARSLKQIVLNLLSNSIKFTGAGGQVIVSTAVTDTGEVSLRVRDTGMGMSESELTTAMEPFRQLATSTRFGSGGTGLGLPLTKALAEANRAGFHISSRPKEGTLVEVVFPGERAAAE